MLNYTEVGVSEREVIGENSLCIYISGCQNHCENCHYPLLQDPNYGNSLKQYFEEMLFAYLPQITCVYFLGEGKSNEDTKCELLEYVQQAKMFHLKVCLYLGRDISIQQEPWLLQFDYLKVGAYDECYGDLSMRTTNQRFYKIEKNKLMDITSSYFEN